MTGARTVHPLLCSREGRQYTIRSQHSRDAAIPTKAALFIKPMRGLGSGAAGPASHTRSRVAAQPPHWHNSAFTLRAAMNPKDYQLDPFWMPFTANRQFKKSPRML
ncbi:MAG: hypothetical protein ACXWIH_11250, partial [Burkholderiales bacterium]